MRIVVDTNVLVRATKRSTGPAREVLRIFESEQHILVLSRFIVTELLRVLNYDRLLPVHRLTLPEQQEYVAAVEKLAQLVEVLPTAKPEAVSRDPEDDPVIATAVAGRASVLCTLDHHLLHPDVRAYCASRGVRVMTDVDLLRLLQKPADA